MRWSRKITSKDRTIKKIMVTGVEKGVGVTHFSILLASYYVCMLGKMVCIVDLSATEDYLCMDRLYNGDNLLDTPCYIYQIKKINFMVQSGVLCRDEMIKRALEQRYDIIIFDNGINTDYIDKDLVMCDGKYIVGDCSSWKAEGFEKQIRKIKNIHTYKYIYAFGENRNADLICRDNSVTMHHIPYTKSPFRIEKKQLSELEKIIWEEKWR